MTRDAASPVQPPSSRLDDPDAARLRQEMAALVDSSGDAIVGTTLAGTITSWNRTAEQFYGYPRAYAVGRPISLIVPLDRLAELEEARRRVARGERVTNLETVRVDRDGLRLDVSVTISPILDADGTVFGVSSIAHDIRERKQAEIRTLALLTLARQAAVAAEVANRAKDEFLALVSHELRTPLTSILGYVQLLRQERLSAETRAEALAALDRSARLQARLVNDLLDVSRLAVGRLSLLPRPVDLVAIARGAIGMLSREAGEKGIRLEVSQTAPQLDVSGDPDRLLQIVRNLLENALKFTPAGGRVCVGLSEEGGGVRLVVSDSGIGIPAELLPHVFDRFWQADPSSTRAYPGMGLGLALVQALVQAHGGRVSASSAGPDQGAEFAVWLPR